MYKIEINHNGITPSTETAPYTDSSKLILNPQPPKQTLASLEIRQDEKEQWYVVSDGVVFTRR